MEYIYVSNVTTGASSHAPVHNLLLQFSAGATLHGRTETSPFQFKRFDVTYAQMSNAKGDDKREGRDAVRDVIIGVEMNLGVDEYSSFL